MGTTAKYGLPYPEASDPPAGDAQIKALAEAVETIIDKGLGGVQSGEVLVTWTGAPAAVTDVTFTRPYKAPPNVVTTLGNEYRNAAASDITTTGFKFRGRTNSDQGATGTSGGWWIAHGELA